MHSEKIPGARHHHGGHRAAQHQHHRGTENGPKRDDRHADNYCRGQLGADGVVRIDKNRVAQHAFQHLGVNLDAGHRRIDRRRLDVA